MSYNDGFFDGNVLIFIENTSATFLNQDLNIRTVQITIVH